MLILIRQKKEKTKKHAEIQRNVAHWNRLTNIWIHCYYCLRCIWMLDFVVCLCIFCALFVTVCRFGFSMFCKCSLLPFAHEVSLNLWMAAVCCMAVAAVVFCFFWVWPKPSWNLPNGIQTQTFYRGKPSMSMHGTKESCHSNHGPQSVLKLNVRNVFSCKPRGQTKQNKHTIYTRETCWSETHLV